MLLVTVVFLGTNYGEILSRYFKDGEEYLKSVNETNHLSGEYHQEVTGLFSLTAYYFQCGAAPAAFIWAAPSEIAQRFALPTAFHMFFEEMK